MESEFTPINKKLPQLAVHTANLLIDKGYKALAKVQTMVVQDSDYRTVLPHKTVATLAGVGFIGKCAALVTKEYGSAARIIVVLTNAPMECGVPVTKSLCGPKCDICTNVCPETLLKGNYAKQKLTHIFIGSACLQTCGKAACKRKPGGRRNVMRSLYLKLSMDEKCA